MKINTEFLEMEKHYSQHLISMFARKKGVFPFSNTCVGRPMRSDRSIPITEQHNKETVKQAGEDEERTEGEGTYYILVIRRPLLLPNIILSFGIGVRREMPAHSTF